jgi:secondary thiamine-phosphate synthase enzyme
MKKSFSISTKTRTELVDITDMVRGAVRASGIKEGLCCIYVPHTTAGVTINEGADPSVKRDILTSLNKLVPFDGDYLHSEGNSAAHIKSTLVGASAVCPIEDGKPALGTWQSVFFCEFDGPRTRSFTVRVVGDPA